MSPTIQPVECPRCGSPHKQPAGVALYQCADCGMSYHLDWVGVSVQVRQPAAPRLSPTTRWNGLPLKVLLLVVLAMLALAGLSFGVASGR